MSERLPPLRSERDYVADALATTDRAIETLADTRRQVARAHRLAMHGNSTEPSDPSPMPHFVLFPRLVLGWRRKAGKA